jgi:glutamate synthase (NADPH/NADH) large chain
MVELEKVKHEHDIDELLSLINLHYENTRSVVAKHVLDNWNSCLKQFVKVMPIDYKRVLNERALHDEERETVIHGVMTDG